MLFKSILTFLILSTFTATDFTVKVANTVINAVTDYSWEINFSPINSRSTITLTFPTNVTVTNSSTVTWNGVSLPKTAFTSTSISFTATDLAAESSIELKVTNVRNPPTAMIANYNFTLTSPLQTVGLLGVYSVSYSSAVLSGCVWSFSLCTEQPNSQLTINLTTTNTIYSGSNKMIVGYAAVWANHNSKNLMFQVTTLSCAYSLDGITYISSSVACSNDAVTNKITVNFTLATNLPGNSPLFLKIYGVQSPPTTTTATTSSYFVSTADFYGYLIDTLAGCTINPICITNITNGVLNSTAGLYVGQSISQQDISFLAYPIITSLPLDTVWIQYSPQTNLQGCNTLKYWRFFANMKTLSVLNPSNYSFIFPNGTYQIIDTAQSINLYIVCTAFIMPNTIAPKPITFHFTRGGSEYLQLTANIVAMAVAFDLSTTSLILSNTEMANTNTSYLFTFNISQTLSNNCAVRIGFHADINIATVTCTLTINTITVPSSCSAIGNVLVVNVSASLSSITSGSQFQITVNGVVNAFYPQMYNFTLQTYSNSSDLSSKVQSSSPAFNTTFTTIISLVPTLTPNTFSLYSTNQMNISLNIPIPLPANSNFTLTFPGELSQLTCGAQPLFINGTQQPISNLVINSTANSISFTRGSAIAINSNLLIAVSFRSPSLLNTYYYVNLIINNTVPYIQCLNQLSVNVNIPSTMPVGIVALTPTTAQQSSYNITITYTVPHPGMFYLSIDLPSDTTYVAAVGLCSPNCSVSGFTSNGSQVTLTINNPNANSTIIFTQTYTVSTFVNRRFVAAGTAANISTFISNSTTGVITKQSALISITSPGLLIGYLDPNVYYTRNNSAVVDLFLNLTVPLLSGDYFLIAMDRTTYDGVNVGCSLYFGTCTADPLSTTNVLIIKIVPNVSTYSGNPWHIKLQNLTSGSTTSYLQTDLITINHLCSGGLIETGKATYQISCNSGAALPNQCRTCYTNGSCIDCYSTLGYYLFNNSCVTSCGNATSFLRYADNTTSVCQLCTSNCLTCINATACMSCADNTFYLYTDTLTCKLTCPLYGGYVNSTLGTQLVCVPCADPFCLHCTSTLYGSCTQCNNISILSNGICSSTCPSISYYILNSQCMLCDASCYSCFSSGSMSCLRCASGYANVSGNCTNACPIGTAFIANLATCGCDTPCLTCSSLNYLNCLTCVNASHFMYLGQCLGSCPAGSYQQNGNCVLCPTGCSNCSSSVCLTCMTGWMLYNSACYSDCNQISQQYDKSGSTCVLCPQGCDTCSGSTCNTCIKDYSLDGNNCISACLLTNSCAVDTSKIVPLPATITLVVWCGVVLLIRFISQSKNYIPYSIIAMSGIIQFTELIICLILSKPSTTRLLFSVSSTTTITGLLVSSLILNYILNLIYIFIFLKYIKPLIYKPKQSDLITHGVVMAIATLTSFRFGLLAYSKLCAKPAVRIQNSSRLTPVHYLCIFCAIFDLLPIIGCGLVLYTQQKWTPLFMLCLDLLIIIIVNIIITIYFMASEKADEYYEDKVKYEVGDGNATHENISNNENGDKDNSKVHIVAVEEFEDNHYASRINQIEKIDLDNNRYKSVRLTKTKVNPNKSTVNQKNKSTIDQKYMEQPNTSGKIKQHQIIENQQLQDAIQQLQTNSKDVFAKEFQDADFEEIAPSKIKARDNYGNSKVTSLRASPKPNRQIDSRVENRDKLAFTLDKQLDEEDHNKKTIHRNVFEPTLEQESDFPQLQEVSMKGDKTKISDKTESVAKQKSENLHQSQMIKPILKQKERTERDRYERKERDRNNMSSILPRGVTHNKNSKKLAQKPQTIDVDRLQRQREITKQKQLQEDDFQSIVRQKVQQSSIHKKYEINLFEDDGQLQDISPSKFNVANQRFRQEKSK